MKVQIVRPFSNTDTISEIVEVYQKAFGGKPWNEGYVCPVCAKVYPRPFVGGSQCYRCLGPDRGQGRQVLLVEYWPKSQVLKDFYAEMNRPNAICIAGFQDGRVVGFAWGYNLPVSEDMNAHLESTDLHKMLDGEFFYLDECALLPEVQGRGLGKQLVEGIFRLQPYSRVILRTMNNSRMHNLITGMGGRVVQQIDSERVIMTVAL